MTTFFQQTAQAMIAKHIDRFPLLKLDQVIDWQPIEQYLNHQRTRYLRDHRGRPAYPLLSMFKAVLLGQWHSLSDPEHSLITRINFNLFCRFDELSIPLIAQASSLVPLQSIVVSELAKSRGKLTNKVYRKSDIWR
jgi:IS5 family transposase